MIAADKHIPIAARNVQLKAHMHSIAPLSKFEYARTEGVQTEIPQEVPGD
jgi:hypothetical protein